MKTPDSQLIASQSYRDKMVKAGYKQIALWVPVEKVEQVKEYAKLINKMFKTSLTVNALEPTI